MQEDRRKSRRHDGGDIGAGERQLLSFYDSTNHMRAGGCLMRITSSTDPLRILLIEDSKGDAILIKKTLTSALPGALDVQTAETLGTALKIIGEHEFDVALLDRSLPDVVGFSGLLSIQ